MADEKYAQYVPGNLKQIDDILVPQIECNSLLNLYFEEIEVFPA